MGATSADAMPVRMTVLHQCFTKESYSFGTLVDFVTRLMPNEARAKIKIHRGKEQFSFIFIAVLLFVLFIL